MIQVRLWEIGSQLSGRSTLLLALIKCAQSGSCGRAVLCWKEPSYKPRGRGDRPRLIYVLIVQNIERETRLQNRKPDTRPKSKNVSKGLQASRQVQL